jgi:hypothetical protein
MAEQMAGDKTQHRTLCNTDSKRFKRTSAFRGGELQPTARQRTGKLSRTFWIGQSARRDRQSDM